MDASDLPRLISRNPIAACIMIGERAAAMICSGAWRLNSALSRSLEFETRARSSHTWGSDANLQPELASKLQECQLPEEAIWHHKPRTETRERIHLYAICLSIVVLTHPPLGSGPLPDRNGELLGSVIQLVDNILPGLSSVQHPLGKF